jgi:hypothetical protein
MLNRTEVGILVSDLRGEVFSPLSMLAMTFSYGAFTLSRLFPFIPSLLSVFNHGVESCKSIPCTN